MFLSTLLDGTYFKSFISFVKKSLFSQIEFKYIPVFILAAAIGQYWGGRMEFQSVYGTNSPGANDGR